MKKQKVIAKFNAYWTQDAKFRFIIYSIAERSKTCLNPWILFLEEEENKLKYRQFADGYRDLILGFLKSSGNVLFNIHSFLNGFFFAPETSSLSYNDYFKLGQNLGENGELTRLYRKYLPSSDRLTENDLSHISNFQFGREFLWDMKNAETKKELIRLVGLEPQL